MSILFMLDTNTSSYVIKGNVPSVRKHLLDTPMSQVCVSVVTQAELLFGIARRPDASGLKTAVQEFLLRVSILPWDSDSAKQYANLRAGLERTGKTLGNLDLMIASHALSVDAVLVSSDQSFKLVKQLSLVDWTR
jgi:tRNA(fMet)-specific endonuclease VapC